MKRKKNLQELHMDPPPALRIQSSSPSGVLEKNMDHDSRFTAVI